MKILATNGIVFEDFDILQKELIKILKNKNLILMEKKIYSFDAWVDQLKLFLLRSLKDTIENKYLVFNNV